MNFIWPKSNKLETQSCHSISRDEPSRDFTDKRKFVEQIQNCTSIHLRIVRCSLLRRPKPIYCKNRPVGCNHRSVLSFSDALSKSRTLIREKNGRVSLRKTEKLLYSWPVFLLSLFVLSFFILPAGRYHANGKFTAHLLIFRVRWIAKA